MIFPLLRLFSSPEDYRRRCTLLLHKGMRLIANLARFFGIVDFEAPVLPPEVDPREPYVMICNHPTFVDMLLLLGWFEGMTCVTSGRWSKHWALGRLLRSTNYLPGPGSGRPESEDTLGAMVDHLKAGHVLLVFPEGRRSLRTKLRRFRRGAVEAATRAGVPIVPAFLGIDRPYLTKDVPLWRPPPVAPVYRFDWFDVVRPEDFDGDARALHDHLVAKYKARFREQRALQRAIERAEAVSASGG